MSDEPATDPWGTAWVIVTVRDAAGGEWQFTSEEMPEVLADILLRDLIDARVVKARKKRKEEEAE